MSDVRCHWSQSVTIDERRQAVIGALLLARSMRTVGSVEYWVEDLDVAAAVQADATAGEKVAECRRWLMDASEIEARNGRESLLDRTHPFWIEKLEPARRRAGQIATRQRTAV